MARHVEDLCLTGGDDIEGSRQATEHAQLAVKHPLLQGRDMNTALSLIIKEVDLATQHETQVKFIFAFAANDLPGIKTAHADRRLLIVSPQKCIALVFGEASEHLELKETLPDYR